MTLPWIAVSIAIAIVLLAVFAFVFKKKGGKFKPWTYENWLEAGGIFLIIGYIMCRFGRDSEVLGLLGILYFTIGIFGKYITKNKKMNAKQRIIRSILTQP